jgi:hypothetical protein
MMFELDPYIGTSCLWGEPSNSLNPKNSPVKEALETLNPKTDFIFSTYTKDFSWGKKP